MNFRLIIKSIRVRTSRALSISCASALILVGLASTPANAVDNIAWDAFSNANTESNSKIFQMDMAVAPNGYTAMVWLSTNGSNNIVQAATRAAGATTFGTTFDISAPGQNANNPKVAVGIDGLTTITWTRSDGSYNLIQESTMAAGASTFSTPANLSTTGYDSSYPDVVIDNNGQTTVVWRVSSSGNVKVATRATAGANFSAQEIASATASFSEGISLAVDASGQVTIAWPARSGGVDSVLVSTRAAGSGAFGTPLKISPSTPSHAEKPQIAVAPNGKTVVAWTQYGGPGNRPYIPVATRNAGETTFSDSLAVSGAFEGTYYGNYVADVAIAPDGQATVAWQANLGSSSAIQVATAPAGSSLFGDPITLSGAGSYNQDAQLAVDPDGQATVSWIKYLTNTYNSFLIVTSRTRLSGASTFASAIVLSASTGQVVRNNLLETAADGKVTATWFKYTGDEMAYPTSTVGNFAVQFADSVLPPRAAQTISFSSNSPANAVAGASTYSANASSTSGLAVALSIAAGSSSVCSISAGVVSFIGNGTCTILANQVGNGSYKAASEVSQTFTVTSAPSESVIAPGAVTVAPEVIVAAPVAAPKVKIVVSVQFSGNYESNKALAIARAQAIRAYLKKLELADATFSISAKVLEESLLNSRSSTITVSYPGQVSKKKVTTLTYHVPYSSALNPEGKKSLRALAKKVNANR